MYDMYSFVGFCIPHLVLSDAYVQSDWLFMIPSATLNETNTNFL
jgi:hypothetical protein